MELGRCLLSSIYQLCNENVQTIYLGCVDDPIRRKIVILRVVRCCQDVIGHSAMCRLTFGLCPNERGRDGEGDVIVLVLDALERGTLALD